jgi:hypothetical protein
METAVGRRYAQCNVVAMGLATLATPPLGPSSDYYRNDKKGRRDEQRACLGDVKIMDERREGTSRSGSCCCRQAGCAGVAGSERGSAKTGRDDAVIAPHSVVEPGKAMKLHPPLPPLGAIVPPGPPSLCPATKSIKSQHNHFSRFFFFLFEFLYNFPYAKKRKQ